MVNINANRIRRAGLAFAVVTGLFAAACGTSTRSPNPSPITTEFSITGSFPVTADRSLAINCGGTGFVFANP